MIIQELLVSVTGEYILKIERRMYELSEEYFTKYELLEGLSYKRTMIIL